eukprot:2693713-Prymnesium_polylepis.2
MHFGKILAATLAVFPHFVSRLLDDQSIEKPSLRNVGQQICFATSTTSPATCLVDKHAADRCRQCFAEFQ